MGKLRIISQADKMQIKRVLQVGNAEIREAEYQGRDNRQRHKHQENERPGSCEEPTGQVMALHIIWRRRLTRRLSGRSNGTHCPLPIDEAFCCISCAACCGEVLPMFTCCISLSMTLATCSQLVIAGGPMVLLNCVWKTARFLSLASVPLFQADCTAGRSPTILN